MSVGIIKDVNGIKKYIKYADSVTGNFLLNVGDVKNLEISGAVGSESVMLKWSDPDDLMLGEKVLAVWSGTKVIRKEGGFPENVDDGVLIVDNKERNQYAETGFIDNTVSADVVYYYTLFPYTIQGMYTVSEKNQVQRQDEEQYDSVLNNNSWDKIVEAISLGVHRELWNIGDTKQIDLTGVQYWNGIYDAMIVDWDHFSLSEGEGSNNITFMLKQLPNISTAYVSSTNKDEGYFYSEFHRDLRESFLNGIPAELKDNLIKVKEYTETKYGFSWYSGLDVFACTTEEVMINSYDDGGTILEYFKTHDAIAQNLSGTAMRYWSRSRWRDTTYGYLVTEDGGKNYTSVTSTGGSWRALFCL